MLEAHCVSRQQMDPCACRYLAWPTHQVPIVVPKADGYGRIDEPASKLGKRTRGRIHCRQLPETLHDEEDIDADDYEADERANL